MGNRSEVLLLAAQHNIPYKRIRRNTRRASARKFQQNRWKLHATMMSLLLAMTPSGLQDNFGLFLDLLIGEKTLF